MISFLFHHIISEPLKRFFLGIGGLFRWCFFQIFNASFEEKYPTNLQYYLDYNNVVMDKNGFTTAQKNFLAGIIIFISFIFLINNFEK